MQRSSVARIALSIAVVVTAFCGATLPVQKSSGQEFDPLVSVMRAALATTTHDPVDIDVWNRNLRVNQFAFRSNTTPEILLKIARIEISGLGIGPGVLTADRVLIDGLELEYLEQQPGQPNSRLVYRAPEIVVDGFSTPVREFPVGNTTTAVAIVRLAVERLAEIKATAVTIPAAWITTGPAQSQGVFGIADRVEHTALNLTIRDLREGRFAAIFLDRLITMGAPLASGRGRTATEISRISINDFNLLTLLAMVNPPPGASDDFRSLFREATVGSFAGILSNGNTVNITAFLVGEFDVRPATVNLNEFITLAETAADPIKSPTQQRNLAEQTATMLAGLRIARSDIRGIKTNSATDGPFELALLRINGLDNGRLSEFILEDVYAPRLKDPLRVGRLAFSSIDVASLIRKSAQLAALQDSPGPDDLAGLALAIEGVEVNSFSLPDRDTGQFIRFESFSASWGRFVGAIPSTLKFATKVALPVSGADGSPLKALADLGFRSLWLSFDASATWTEAAQTITIPARIEFEGLISATATVSINNVQRKNFDTDPTKFGEAANDLEAGPVEFSFRDIGGLDLLIAHFAKTQNLSLESARREIKENIDRAILGQPQTSAEVQRLSNALGRFVAARGATLKISITPKERVNLMQLMDLVNVDPFRALSQFNLDLAVDR